MQVFTQEKQFIFDSEEMKLLEDTLSIARYILQDNPTLAKESYDDKRKEEVMAFIKEMFGQI